MTDPKKPSTAGDIEKSVTSPEFAEVKYPTKEDLDNKDVIQGLYSTITSFNARLMDFKTEINEKVDSIKDEIIKTIDYKLKKQSKENHNEAKETTNIGDNDSMNNEIKKTLNDIEKENIEIKNDIKWISKIVFPAVIATVVGVGAILLAVIIFGYDSLNNNINSKFDQINTKFEYFEKYADQKIENEVNKKFLEQSKNKAQ